MAEVQPDALGIFGMIVSYAWDLLSFEVPGLAVDCKTFVAVLITINVSVRILNYAFNDIAAGQAYRAGQSRRKYISEKRKGDQW